MAARGRVWLVGSGATALNPIHAEDLAQRIVETLDAESPADIDVGGPDRLTQREIGQLAFSALGRPARFGHIPPGLMRLAANALRPLNANTSAFLELFASLGENDAVAPPFGRRRLEEQMQIWARGSRP